MAIIVDDPQPETEPHRAKVLAWFERTYPARLLTHGDIAHLLCVAESDLFPPGDGGSAG